MDCERCPAALRIVHYAARTPLPPPEMAATLSKMLPLGTLAPDFGLPDTEGGTVRLADFADRGALLVIFICNHCPYVKHLRSALAELGHDFQARGVGVVAISANDPAQYPEDGPEAMRREKRDAGYPFPYLFDETQEVARAYQAACTPDFFLFDGEGRLVYRGQFDDSRPNNGRPVTGRDLRAALERVLAGGRVPPEQTPSVGCNIKWKPGNAPAPFG